MTSVELAHQETTQQAHLPCVVTMMTIVAHGDPLHPALTLALGTILMTDLHHTQLGVMGHHRVVIHMIAEVLLLTGTQAATLLQVAVREPLLGHHPALEMISTDPLHGNSFYIPCLQSQSEPWNFQ